jgi:hypothetical protein
MRTGRPVAKIELSAEVAGIPESYTQRRKTAQALALRARIVFGCTAGLSNKAVAAGERATPQTSGSGARALSSPITCNRQGDAGDGMTKFLCRPKDYDAL